MKPARIIVLVIALAAGGIAALLAGRSDAPQPQLAPVAQIETVDVLVAGNDIGVGTTVSGQDLRWQLWPAAAVSSHFIRKDGRPDAINQLAGSITRQPFAAGEPIREAKLIKAKGSGYMSAILPQGKRAISTDITPETGAGGFILPNDHVDVILARRDKDAEKGSGSDTHTGEIILANVRVLAIDQTVEEKSGQRVVVGKTATLELAPHQAEELARAKMMGGQLTLALRSIVDFEAANTEADQPLETRRNVNVIRFGVTTTTTSK
jgi:pilus assembly protein CpaB